MDATLTDGPPAPAGDNLTDTHRLSAEWSEVLRCARRYESCKAELERLAAARAWNSMPTADYQARTATRDLAEAVVGYIAGGGQRT